MAESAYQPYIQNRNYPLYRAGRVSPPRPNETPSPSRSPIPQSPGGYVMFQSGPQQQPGHPQHVLMNNGSQPHNRYLQKSLAHPFQPHTQHNQQLHQQQAPQISDRLLNHAVNTPTGQNGHPNHQHTYSGGPISASSFGGAQQHLSNGNSNSTPSVSSNVSSHWQEQLQLHQTSRQSGSPHHQARVAATKTKTGAGNKGGSTVLTTSSDTEDADANDNFKRPIQQRKLTEKEERQEWVALDMGGQGIRALGENLFTHYTFLDKLYINHNKLTVLPASIGKLKRLTYLDASSNALTEIPSEIGMLTNLRTLLLFDNRITTLPGEMGTLYQLEVLGIEGNPLQEPHRAKMMAEGTNSMITFLRENCEINLPESSRAWNVLDGSGSTEKVDTEKMPDRFSVISYNILAEKYGTTQAYGYAPSWVLNWDMRKNTINQDILSNNADIICLQEVDLNNFEDNLSPTLAYQDYKGFCFQKSRARNFDTTQQRQVDGCATFWKTTKFNLLDKQVVNFQALAINRPDVKKTTDIFNRVMPRDDIGTIALLENKLTGGRIVVANCHLFWNPEFADVKLIQTAVLMEEISKMANKYASQPPPSKIPKVDGEIVIPEVKYPNGAAMPLIICGDFNSMEGSGVYELISKGSVPPAHKDLGGRDYGNLSAEGIFHPFNLKSAYSVLEIPFTNYTTDFSGVIDYIWYSTNCMQVTGLLGEVDKEYMSKVAGFPNINYPSDHLMISAEFYMKPPRKEAPKPPPPDFGNTSRK